MTSDSIVIVLVHYHAGAWLPRAISALRTDLDRSGLGAELIVVDNGSDPTEADQIRNLPVRCLDAGGNRGYAGGVNLGVAASQADFIFVMNPDVEVLPGCLTALLAALKSDAAAVGPHFYWDRERRLSLPPTERRTRRHELLRSLAERNAGAASMARRLWRTHARRHWLATGPLPSTNLSGALLGFRRDAWDRVGPFDEGFKLYYEENDWLERLRIAGLRSYYIRSAEAVHYYNQSAAHSPEAAAWFHESAIRFGRRYYGEWFAGLRSTVVRAIPSTAPPPSLHLERPSFDPYPLGSGDSTVWVEVSPSTLGFPAAAELLTLPRTPWSLPEDVGRHLANGRYGLRLVDERGREGPEFSFVSRG